MSIILILVAGWCGCRAQEELRTWDMGPLSWDDFTLTDSSRGENHSYLEFFFSIEEFPEGLWAMAFMDTHQSWVDKNWRTDNELLYNQVIFDLVEWQRRQMQMALDTLLNRYVDRGAYGDYIPWQERDTYQSEISITTIKSVPRSVIWRLRIRVWIKDGFNSLWQSR